MACWPTRSPHLRPPILALLGQWQVQGASATTGERDLFDALLQQSEQEDVEAFELLVHAAYVGYYGHPQVRAALAEAYPSTTGQQPGILGCRDVRGWSTTRPDVPAGVERIRCGIDRRRAAVARVLNLAGRDDRPYRLREVRLPEEHTHAGAHGVHAGRVLRAHRDGDERRDREGSVRCSDSNSNSRRTMMRLFAEQASECPCRRQAAKLRTTRRIDRCSSRTQIGRHAVRGSAALS